MWFGRPGHLVQLPDPQAGIRFKADRGSSLLTSVEGAVTVQYAYPHSKQVWDITYDFLTDEEADIILGYHQGWNGRGPWVMLFDAKRNMLTANQSTGTDASADTTGFTASTGTLSSATDSYTQGSRSLAWDLPSSATGSPYLGLPWSGSTYGYPVLSAQSYAFSADLAGSSTSLRLRMDLVWFDVSGVIISTTSWSPFTPDGSLSSYTPAAVVGIAPDEAAYVQPRITASTPVDSAQIRVDALQLEAGYVGTTWTGGYGTPLVSIVDPDMSSPLKGYVSMGTVTFQEVG